jgi:Holliday junction resolvase
MTKYDDGYRLECAARNAMRVNGYLVIRSAGSKGAADLVCLKKGEILFVQAKKSAGQMTPGERARLIEMADLVQGFPLAARWAKEGRAARTVAFEKLTGAGPHDLAPWTPDYALETS